MFNVSIATTKDFSEIINSVVQISDEYYNNITVYDLAYYNACSCFEVTCFDTGKVVGGFAVTSQNELINVFSLERGVGTFMRNEWLKMTCKLILDCMEHLIPFYEKAGFSIVKLENNWDGVHLPKVAFMSQG